MFVELRSGLPDAAGLERVRGSVGQSATETTQDNRGVFCRDERCYGNSEDGGIGHRFDGDADICGDRNAGGDVREAVGKGDHA